MDSDQGHLFCKECIYKYLLTKKKEYEEQMEAYQQMIQDEEVLNGFILWCNSKKLERIRKQKKRKFVMISRECSPLQPAITNMYIPFF